MTLTALFDRLYVRMIYNPTVKKKFSTYSIFENIVFFSVVLSLQQLRQKRQQHIHVQKNILLLGRALSKFSQQILLISLHLWIQSSVKLFENANVCIKWNTNDKN